MESTSGSKTNDGDLEAALELNPVVKLLAFYQDLLLSSTNKAEGILPPGKNELETWETVGKSMKLGALEASRRNGYRNGFGSGSTGHEPR